MFNDNLKTEAIPERIYELLRLISEESLLNKEAKEKFSPSGINESNTSYYPTIRNVCIDELKLIKNTDNKLSYIGDKEIICTIDSFRRYCNKVVYDNKDSYFFKIISCFLESNDEWLKYKRLTDANVLRYIRDNTGINIDPKMINAIRFWISFLGFGYIQEDSNIMYFLPNMHIALQDFCENSILEKDKEYTIGEFIENIFNNASVALNKSINTHEFNLAMSNALRQMHDQKEIILKRNLDSKEIWKLYRDEYHEFNEDITHIIFKGVKRL